MKSVKVNGLIKKQISEVEYRFYNELGELHRTDGPAIVHNEYESWYYEGQMHRIDGPAFIGKSTLQYAILGKFLKESEFEKEALEFKLQKLKNL